MTTSDLRGVVGQGADNSLLSSARSSSSSSSCLKVNKLRSLLDADNLDIGNLRSLLWSGVPSNATDMRPEVWKIMLGYLPLHLNRRTSVLKKKRLEYWDLIDEYHANSHRSENEHKLLRQIKVDLPRTSPSCKIFSHDRLQLAMERILYTWAVRHPASGYVQGINDLVTPFLLIFLFPVSEGENIDAVSLEQVSESVLREVEADSYWCLSKVLGDIQDNFTMGQPGIQRLISKLRDIVRRIDEQLYVHLQAHGVDFLQFAFRWMNCLLMRELPMRCIVRLWDTYIAEEADGFSTFHTYVCAVFLVYWSNQLKMMDFQQMMIFLQSVPTSHWTVKEIDTLLAEAYVLKSLFHASPKHLM